MRSADVAAVDQGRAGGIDLGHKGVIVFIMAQIGPAQQRESALGGLRRPRHIGIAGAVHGDAPCVILMRSADVAAVDQHRRVQHQSPGPVVIADRESVLPRAVLHISLELVGHGHIKLPFPLALPSHGDIVAKPPQRRFDIQSAVGTHIDCFCPAVGEANLLGVGPRMDNELVLHLADRPGIDQVDPGPEVSVDNLTAGSDPGLPLLPLPLEVGDGRLRLPERFGRHFTRAHEILLQNTALARGTLVLFTLPDLPQGTGLIFLVGFFLWRGQHVGESLRCEINAHGSSLDRKRNLRVELPAIGLEQEWQLAEVLRHLGLKLGIARLGNLVSCSGDLSQVRKLRSGEHPQIRWLPAGKENASQPKNQDQH